jgi:hypothetical protein
MEHLKKINMSDREIMDAKNGIDRKSYGFRDPVVKHVVNKFVARSDIGYEKYGRTLDVERKGGFKDLAGYLNDIQEELMDAVLYIQAAREELEDREKALALAVIGEDYGDEEED